MQQSDAAVASTSLDNHATESIGAKGWAPNRNNLTYKNAKQKKPKSTRECVTPYITNTMSRIQTWRPVYYAYHWLIILMQATLALKDLEVYRTNSHHLCIIKGSLVRYGSSTVTFDFVSIALFWWHEWLIYCHK